jgi:peptide/nickel transport system ATP-binding protein
MDNPQEVAGPPLLDVVNVSKRFVVRGSRQSVTWRRHLTAVDGVSFSLRAGEITALVGESGSGKSTVARMLSRLETPSGGYVNLHGERVRFGVPGGRRAYLRQVQLIFQDPFASLNPVHTVRYHLERPLRVHQHLRSQQDVERGVAALLEEVHLTPPSRFIDCYPHQLSGGQRQRVAIARALAVGPKVVLADEPVSMLDVSIRLGVLNLLAQLVEERGLALMYITHDIASARYFAATTHVMYSGQLIESGPSEDVTQSPRHPYTQLLLESSPDPTRSRKRIPLSALEVAHGNIGTGCRFQPRCPYAMPRCAEEASPRQAVGGKHWAACWLLAPVPADGQ